MIITNKKEIDARLSKPDTDRGKLQRACLELLREHEREGTVPTNGRREQPACFVQVSGSHVLSRLRMQAAHDLVERVRFMPVKSQAA
jgi:hypothetical protein